MVNAEAEQFKAEGNAALQAGRLTEAVESYTAAIRADGSNHVYFSNRSAAHLKKGDATNALEDAESVVGLNPKFAKGYSRKGAALHALGRFNDAAAAFEVGLVECPGDAALKKGLEDVKRDRDGGPARRAMSGGAGGLGGMMGGMGGMPGLGGMFGPEMIARLALDPKTRPYLNDADFMVKIKKLQEDPNCLPTMLSDPRIMEVLGVALGAQKEMSEAVDEGVTRMDSGGIRPNADKGESTVEEVDDMEEDDVEDVTEPPTPEELKAREEAKAAAVAQKAALAAKLRGNDLYKAKKFDEALAAYDEAIALDPTSMTFHNNKAAVYMTSKKFDECIAACDMAVEVGKANRASFEDRHKALARCAKAYQKKGDLGKAIEKCKEAQLESYEKTTERLMKTMEQEKKKADVAAYQSDEKAEEAKQKGNDHFRNKNWPDAVKEYEEAVKRAPKNAPIRNNLAAALCKVMDFNGAKSNIEKAIEIDPKYVKAWARKGDIEVLMKENHKALESYKKGMEIDGTNAACREGLRKVTAMINYGNSTMTEDEKLERARHGMADPDIQSILTDPVIQQILKDFNENPQAANAAMSDPGVRAKIEKLIASGVVQTA